MIPTPLVAAAAPQVRWASDHAHLLDPDSLMFFSSRP